MLSIHPGKAAFKARARQVAQNFRDLVPPNESRPRVIATYQIVIILVGAVAGGFVNGLTGFGTALTA